MKIVNRKTFLSMPSGVLFSKYHPCVFEVPQIKGDTWPECGDFLVQEIVDAVEGAGSDEFFDACQLMEEGGSAAVDMNCMGRDGSFDADQLFAVWEQADLAALIARLQKCVGAP